MLDQKIFKELKQVNVSNNPTKTMERVRKVWKEAPSETRQEILTLANLTKYPVERSYKLGNLSAKLAAAFAQVLSVDPYYLVGETDVEREYSDDLLIEFLSANGYKKLFDSAPKAKRKNNRQPAANLEVVQDEIESQTRIEDLEPIVKESVPEKAIFEQDLSLTDVHDGEQLLDAMDLAAISLDSLTAEEKELLDQMTEDEVVVLVKGLLLRSKFSEEAKCLSDFVKLILIG